MFFGGTAPNDWRAQIDRGSSNDWRAQIDRGFSNDRGLHTDSQDVAFQPSHASFHSTFPENNGRGYGLWSATCLRTMVGDK